MHSDDCQDMKSLIGLLATHRHAFKSDVSGVQHMSVVRSIMIMNTGFRCVSPRQQSQNHKVQIAAIIAPHFRSKVGGN